MTESNNQSSKLPTHTAFHVRDGKGDESYWTRIGCGWAHADGKGINIQIETVPLDGRITLRVPSEKTN